MLVASESESGGGLALERLGSLGSGSKASEGVGELVELK